MRALAVFGGVEDPGATAPPITVDGMAVRSAIIEIPEPDFDPADPALVHSVLVRVSAFSCNFRDKAFIYRLQRLPSNRFFVIGSEFCGVVVATGREVTTLRVTDRVIGENHYTGMLVDAEGVTEGIPTNSASKEFLILHERKVCRIPDEMSDAVGASFGVGAQTTYSMVRRLAPPAGSKVLVPSGSSNTSLFLIAALSRLGARVFTTTTSDVERRLHDQGAERVIRVVGPSAEAIVGASSEIGGFDFVFDPFFDLHLEVATRVLRPFGSYVTCGLLAQTPGAGRGAPIPPLPAEAILVNVMAKNLSIVGNCIGLHSDLRQALEDYAGGRLNCVVDSEFGGTQAPGFLARTYEDRKRFGKVVFRY
jgi:NADPH:quinone reductase-like Zn-dependent oxidoreductase